MLDVKTLFHSLEINNVSAIKDRNQKQIE